MIVVGELSLDMMFPLFVVILYCTPSFARTRSVTISNAAQLFVLYRLSFVCTWWYIIRYNRSQAQAHRSCYNLVEPSKAEFRVLPTTLTFSSFTVASIKVAPFEIPFLNMQYSSWFTLFLVACSGLAPTLAAPLESEQGINSLSVDVLCWQFFTWDEQMAIMPVLCSVRYIIYLVNIFTAHETLLALER
jgi:hypothetical protein